MEEYNTHCNNIITSLNQFITTPISNFPVVPSNNTNISTYTDKGLNYLTTRATKKKEKADKLILSSIADIKKAFELYKQVGNVFLHIHSYTIF